MFLVAKIEHKDFIKTLRVIKSPTSSQSEKNKAMLDVIDLLSHKINNLVGTFIGRNPGAYKKNEKQIKQFVFSELASIIMEDFNIEKYDDTDIGRAINYLTDTLSKRVSKFAFEIDLGENPLIGSRRVYWFNFCLKKYVKMYGEMPVLQKGTEDLTNFAALYSRGNEQKALADSMILGKGKVKSIDEPVKDDKTGEGMSLTNVLRTDEKLPDAMSEDVEVKEKFLPLLERVLIPYDPDEYPGLTYKAFMTYHDPEQKEEKQLTKEELTERLQDEFPGVSLRQIVVALWKAKTELVKHPQILSYKSNKTVDQMVKYACDNFEIIFGKTAVRIARKNEETLIKEILNKK